MIAKIVKGSNFRGVVNYILDKEKDAMACLQKIRRPLQTVLRHKQR